MRKTKRQNKFSAGVDLTSIQPYYIDRRQRSPIIHSPRCLSSHRRAAIPSFNCCCSTLASANQDMTHDMQKSSQQQEESTLHGVLTVKDIDLIQTKVFKQKLEKLLKKYYQLEQQKHAQLTQKVKKERMEQMQRIALSIQNLIKQNRKIYEHIKKERNISERLLAQLKIVQKLRRKQRQLSSSNQLINNTVNSDYDKSLSQQRDRCFRIKQSENQLKQIQSIRKPLVQLNLSQNKLISQQDGVQEKQNSKQCDILLQRARQFLINYQEGGGNTNIKQSLNELMSSLDKADQKWTSELRDQLAAEESGSQKFYKLIKQLVAKKKYQTKRQLNSQQKKQGEEKGKSNKKGIGIFLKTQHIKTQRGKKISPNHNQSFQKGRSLISSRLKSLKNSNNSYSNSPKHKKKVGLTSKQPKNIKQNLKEGNIIKPINNQKESSVERQFERRSDKKKTVRTRFQIGTNYAKMLSKLLRGQNDSNSDRYRLRHKKTRMGHLRKKNKFIPDQELNLQQAGESNKQGSINNLGIVSETESEPSSTPEHQQQEKKSVKLTKYEEARLYFNMRYKKAKDRTNKQSVCYLQLPLSQHHSKQNSNLRITNEQQSQVKGLKQSFTPFRNDGNEFDMLNNNDQTISINSRWSKRISNFSGQSFGSSISLCLLPTYSQFDLAEVKSNITSYLKKMMHRNQKAKQLYNFLMFMQESCKLTLEQQEMHSSLDQLQLQKQQEGIQSLVSQIRPKIQDYESCQNLFKDYNWNEKDLTLRNKKFFHKLDEKSIELMSWDEEDFLAKKLDNLRQGSLKQICLLPT